MRETLSIDLNAALLVDSGMRVSAEEGSGYVTARLWTTPFAFGARYAHFYLTNVTDKPAFAVPCFGTNAHFRAIGHHRVWCDRGCSSSFRFRVPDDERIDRLALYVERPGLQCLFVSPLSGAIRTIELGSALLAVGSGAAIGVVAALAWLHIIRSLGRRDEAQPAPSVQPEQPQSSPVQSAPPLPAQRSSGNEGSDAVSRVRYADAIVEDPQSHVVFAGDGDRVVASLELLERKLASANYVVKVVNDSREPLLCATMDAHGKHHAALRPFAFRVEAGAASAVLVNVPLRVWSPFHRVTVSLRSRTVSSSLQAAVPANRLLAPLAAIAALLLAIALSVATYVQMRPQIAAYAVPSVALAGSQIRAAYAVSGVGQAAYDVTERNRRVASGTLSSGSGYFEFPSSLQAARYRVALSVSGPLGTQSETRTLRTVEQQRTASTNAVALIHAFEVDSGVVQSGDPIVVRYSATAQIGALRLLDAAQLPVARASFRPAAGTSVMTAPQVSAPTPYRLELTVRQRSSAQLASIGVMVVPRQRARGGATGTSMLLSQNELFRFVPSYVVGGSTVHVDLLQHPAQLRLVLQDARGVPIASRDVLPSQSRIDFPVPAVALDQHFVIVASFSQGNGDQVLIAPLTVHAH